MKPASSGTLNTEARRCPVVAFAPGSKSTLSTKTTSAYSSSRPPAPMPMRWQHGEEIGQIVRVAASQ